MSVYLDPLASLERLPEPTCRIPEHPRKRGCVCVCARVGGWSWWWCRWWQWDKEFQPIHHEAGGVHLALGASQVKNYSPGYMEQAPSRGHEASPQSGLGVGCKLCSSSKKLRGLSACAQARRISIPLIFFVLGVSLFLSPPRSAMRRGAWKRNTGPR